MVAEQEFFKQLAPTTIATRILLVDDDEDDYILTKELFAQLDQQYELSWCSSYEAGINAMLKGLYDVYLVDYRLGKYTGIELLREAINSNVSEPVIILTGKGDFQVDDEALRNGAADYLIKDKIDPLSLERSIRYSIMQTNTLRRLKESENKFRIIFERSLDPILISDYSGRIYDINKAGEEFFGLPYKDVLKRNAREFYKNIEDRVAFTQQMEENGVVNDLELELLDSKGKTRYCSVSAFVQIAQDGSSELYHIIIHDLTFRKQQEQQSVSTEKLAVSERIAKSLATEIRNPLSNVNLAVDELVADIPELNENTRMYIDIIRSNCERIAQLTNQFISSTHPEPVEFTPFDAATTVSDLLEEFSKLLDAQNIRFFKEVEPNAVTVKGDQEKLKTAIHSLLKNAIESMNGFSRILSVRTSVSGSTYQIEVQDTGEGIAPEHASKIFEPFFSTKKKGSGLGLTNAQNIIHAHGGKISFETKVGSGTTFKVTLPLNR